MYFNKQFPQKKLSSLFFGGGTPGIFTDRLVLLVDKVRPYLREDAEVSLEVNPNNISKESLKIWSEGGFNRISIGIQTFEEQGLKFLKRDHNPKQALNAILLSHLYFEKVNVDLIYGWLSQDLSLWHNDLKTGDRFGD